MPAVNYNEGVAEVTPQATVPNDYQSSSAATPAAFGGQLAEGAEKLGQGALKASEFYGQAAADDASNQLQDSAAKLFYGDPNKAVTGPDGKAMPDTGYLGMKGADAMHARPQIEQQIDDKIKELRGNLGTPESQLQFDNFSRRYRAMLAEKIGAHADQQTTVYATNTNTATAKLALDHIANNFDNPKESRAGFEDLISAYAKNAQLAGAQPGDAQYQAAFEAAQRDALQAQLNAMAVKDPSRALDTLDLPKNRAIAGVKYDDMANSFRARADQQDGFAKADRMIADKRAQAAPAAGGSFSQQLQTGLQGDHRSGVVNGEIPPEGQVLLDRIAATESRGRYDVRYGGAQDKTFEGYGDHPRVAEPITSGPDVGNTSSAAGRYQFIAPTWDQEAKKLGLKDFSPANQDAAAWDLAQTEYKAKTGKDLLSVLKSGDQAAIDAVPRALSGQWSSLPGGRQPAAGIGSLSPSESLVRQEGELKLQVLSDPDMANRPQMQAAALNRINVTFAAQREAQASDAAAFKLKLQNSTAEALQTGAVRNPLAPDEFNAAFGGDEGVRQYHDYLANVQLGADMRAVASMAPEEIDAMQQRYQPQAGSDDYAAQTQRAAELSKAVEANSREMKADPAAFLIRRTDVGGEAWQRFSTIVQDKTKSPEEKQVAAGMFAEKMLAEQARLGVPEAERRVAPKSYTQGISDAMTGAATSDDAGARAGVIGMVKQDAALWGKHWPDVMREIAPTLQPVVRAIAAGADESAMMRLLSIDPKDPKAQPTAILKEQNAVKASEVTTAVNTEMAPFLSTMVGRQRDRDYGSYLGLANELAALYVRDGKDASTAAHDAFNALVGNRYEFRDTYRIPKDPAINADDVQHGAQALRNQLGTLGAVPPLDDIPGRSDTAPGDDLAKLGRDGTWVTSPRNDGLNLAYGDKWVRGGDGRPLFVPWADLAKAGRDASTAAAAQPDLSVQP